MVTRLCKEGYLEKNEARVPSLTEKGKEAWWHYSARLDCVCDHMLENGVDPSDASEDALHIAFELTDASFETLQARYQNLGAFQEIAGQNRVSGAVVVQHFPSLKQACPFLIMEEGIPAPINRTFTHPCHVSIRDGSGTISLVARANAAGGRLHELAYFDKGSWIIAERRGDIFSIPLDVMEFTNAGGISCLCFQGSRQFRAHASSLPTSLTLIVPITPLNSSTLTLEVPRD